MKSIREYLAEGKEVTTTMYRVLRGGELKMIAWPAVRHKDIGMDSVKLTLLLEEVLAGTGMRYLVVTSSSNQIITSTLIYPSGRTLHTEGRAVTQEELSARG
jgi:hypothetical protein